MSEIDLLEIIDDCNITPRDESVYDKQHYEEMLQDCLIIWRPWEVERAKELGVLDEETAKTLAIYDPFEDWEPEESPLLKGLKSLLEDVKRIREKYDL